MLKLRFHVDGEERLVALDTIDQLPAGELRFGRSGDNDVVLPDYSVSRRHAAIRREAAGFVVRDLQSTNGIKVNGETTAQAVIRAGDRVEVGVFELSVLGTVGQMPAPPPPPMAETDTDAALSNATIVRSLKDLSAELALLDSSLMAPPGEVPAQPDRRQEKREALDQAYASNVFGVLARLAKLLIATDSDEEILRHLMDVAFEVFPVDRGFILLREDDSDALHCELSRSGTDVEYRPSGPVPISETMLQAVMRERVALLTYDALSDQRLAGTESVRIHQIRAAMCTPLWSGEKIIGVLQLDTPQMGTFTEPDVDLLATLANYGAVAIERNRNARDAEFQREVRNRLQRYHSPAVIEQVLQDDLSAGNEASRLRRAQVTVMFSDIVGFTAYSEHADPEEVAELMERYFTYAVEAIFRHGGTLDKFIGDCVMAFFGAPFEYPDHAFRAVKTAIDMRTDLAAWNAERRAKGLSEVMVRTAINTGPVVVGDIGSNRRVDYTVLGNTVNVTARLEERVAKPGDIVLGDATHRALAGRVPTEALGGFQLKGLSQEIQAHRVPDPLPRPIVEGPWSGPPLPGQPVRGRE